MLPSPLFVAQLLLAVTVLAPGLLFAALGIGWLAGWTPRETSITRSAKLVYGLATVSIGAVVILMWSIGLPSLSAGTGIWYGSGQSEVPTVLFADLLSLPLLALTVVLVGLVAVFSERYLHRDPGFHRFFVLLHLFAFGALLTIGAGSFALLIAGWELVGVSSALLIAFFQERPEPARSAIRVFLTYEICDNGIFVGVFVVAHLLSSTLYTSIFTGAWPEQTSVIGGSSATLVSLLLLLAAMGKSAQVPLSGWMPRAMEGPTPSSAIFYGAISVHMGAYLLLRAQPLLAMSPVASGVVILVGALSAVHGTMVARVSSDAKTALAYASVSQLGLIFVEIGLGLSWLALFHIIGHAIVRTLQFLKAPSALHEAHELHAAAGGHLAKTGAHLEAVLPARLRNWLYWLALDRGHHDAILERLASAIRRMVRKLTSIEERLMGIRGVDG